MLKARLAVAAVGLPLLALLVLAPEPVFGAVVTLLLAAAALELMRAAVPQGGLPPALLAAAAVALLAASARSVEALRLWPLLPLLVLALVLLLRPSCRPQRPAGAWWLVAVLYVGVLGGHWLLLRSIEGDVDAGQRWVALLLTTTFATDTGAYAVGRLVGRHRLAPAISPGKTWEGLAGGLFAGAVGALAALALLGLEPGAPAVVAIAALLPPAAVAGDLLESAIKRRAQVKDTSALLPGHGGLLDRLDSLLVAGPLLYWLVKWLTT